jgi:hypothetical protein
MQPLEKGISRKHVPTSKAVPSSVIFARLTADGTLRVALFLTRWVCADELQDLLVAQTARDETSAYAGEVEMEAQGDQTGQNHDHDGRRGHANQLIHEGP